MIHADNDDLQPRAIWLCADDYGMAPGVNMAIRDLIAHGRLNATSVMVGAPACDRDAITQLIALRDGPDKVAVGLHVTLTAPFTPLTTGFRPRNAEAFLPLAGAAKTATLRGYNLRVLSEEITAQLDAFIGAFGRAPDFCDGHQHIHLFPQVRDVFLSAVARRAPHAWVRQCGRPTPLRHRVRDPKALYLDILSRGFRHKARRQGVSVNPAFAGAYNFRAQPELAAIFPTFLDGLPAGSVVMCHPGFVDDHLIALDPITDQRKREYDYFKSDGFLGDLAAQGLTLARLS
jgi:predicted glycoside hydrolase/deacetylase ChbG (UPF0249 family)